MSEPRTQRPRSAAARALVAMLATLGAVVIALSGVGGSYALWNGAVTTDAGVIEAGTAGLAATWSAGQGDAQWSNLLPGESARRSATITNTGDADLALSTTVIGAAGFELRAASGDCPAAQLAGSPVAGGVQSLGVTLAPGASTGVCIEVRATSDAAPGQQLALNLTFDGKQVQR